MGQSLRLTWIMQTVGLPPIYLFAAGAGSIYQVPLVLEKCAAPLANRPAHRPTDPPTGKLVPHRQTHEPTGKRTDL